MQIPCPRCQTALEYSGATPKFCSNCGSALGDSGTAPDLMETAAFERDSQSADSGGATSGQPPERLAGYRLIRELGRGGMGVVYEAEQEATGRHVAIKLLADNVRRNEPTVARFLQEAKFAAAFSHPRSTFVYEAGEAAGLFYIAMELMPGGTLKDIVERERRLPTNQAVDAILDVVDGLSAAHRAGVIHRDVKPSNCFLDAGGRVKVGDYGLSKSLISDAALTRTGAFMGTPQFAAPEQIRGQTIDERTDIYAVGATLFYLLTGEPPFQGDAARVIAGIAAETAPRLGEKGVVVPGELERLVSQALEKDPAQRPANLDQLRAGLLPFASGGTSIADLGRRLAAYFVDTTLVAITSGLAVSFLVAALMVMAPQNPGWGASYPLQLGTALVLLVILIAYFGVFEGLWSRGLGKTLMGLRVVNLHGEPPGLIRGTLRACVMPGFVWFVGRVLEVLLDTNTGSRWGPPERAHVLRMMVFGQLYPFLGWMLSLLLLASMRLRNGYRGTHELLSGTRVVRHRQTNVAAGLRVPITLPEVIEETPQVVGPYRIVGGFGGSDSRTVFQGRDESLGRSVWVFVNGERQSQQRSALTRPTRLHWLQGGETDGSRWDAFEAVQGSPLAASVRRGGLPWPDACRVLLDLTEELLAATADETLPNSLSMDQVWLDKGHRAKLLDKPIVDADDTRFSGPERGGELLMATMQRCCSSRMLPGQVQEFVHQSAERLREPGGLAWAKERLLQLTDRSGDLSWDERLGVVAVSSGTEMTVLYAAACCLAWLVSFAQLPTSWSFLAAVAATSVLPAGMGFCFRGGPVFRFTGVNVVQKRGEPAGRLRCTWRNLVAWLPAIASYTSIMWFVMHAASLGDATTEATTPFAVLWLALVMIVGNLLHLGGALFAVLSPHRGIQDALAGTYLVSR